MASFHTDMHPDPDVLDSRRTTAEFAAAAPTVALLPLGATEQHGAHLPCGTDTFQVDYLADEIARRLPVWRLPTIPIIVSHMHRGAPGTVWVTNQTLMALVKDVVLSVCAQGITRVVIVNGHGGNFVVRPIIQDLNRDDEDLRVILLEPALAGSYFEEPAGSIHAGESETSCMLHVAPALVSMELAVNTDVPYTQRFPLYAPIGELTPAGVWGHAARATAEKGRRYYEALVPAAVEAIQDTFAALDRIRRARRHRYSASGQPDDAE